MELNRSLAFLCAPYILIGGCGSSSAFSDLSVEVSEGAGGSLTEAKLGCSGE